MFFIRTYRDEIGTYSMKKQRTNMLLLSNNQLFTKADTCTMSRLIPTQRRSDSQKELDLFCYILNPPNNIILILIRFYYA